MAIKLESRLILDRCPHCGVDKPNLVQVSAFNTSNYNQLVRRLWKVYSCARCGGVVTASAVSDNSPVLEMFPSAIEVDSAIPQRAREYLKQSIDSMSAPVGAVILASSSVDAMLKAKDLNKGDLYTRIDKAASDHLITEAMAAWAHEVRLGANSQRHADEEDPLPTEEDAKKAIDFVQALGMFLFVLPARVRKGRGIDVPKGDAH